MMIVLLVASTALAACGANFYSTKAEVSVLGKNDDDGLRYARESTRLDPRHAPGWYWMGIALARKGQDDEALNALQRCLALNPSVAQRAASYNWLGGIYYRKGRLDQAVSYYRQAVQQQPVARDEGYGTAVSEEAHKRYQKDLDTSLPQLLQQEAEQRQQEERRRADERARSMAGVDEAQRLEEKGQLRQALERYRQVLNGTLSNADDDKRVRERIIGVVRRLTPPPAVPEDARRYLVYGLTAVKDARSASDYQNAVREYQRALLVAP